MNGMKNANILMLNEKFYFRNICLITTVFKTK